MYHIIVNPVAGHGHGLVRLPFLARLFESGGVPYEVLQTTAPMDGYEKARNICAAGSDGIIGIGGDGTIQEIVAGMEAAFAGQACVIPVPLGIFPCGSGNDFVLTVEGGKSATVRKYDKRKDGQAAQAVFEAVINGRTRSVDIMKADGMAFLNIGNIGIDARIVRNALGFKKRFGRYAYLAAAYKSIARHENIPLTINMGDEVLEGSYTLAAVCNGQYYGGGMHIAPCARLDDGLITVCLAEAMSRLEAMAIFPLLLLKLHTYLRKVRFVQCETLTVTMPRAETLCLDGNLYEKSGSITFEVLPKALRIFV
ncbi:MAG: hypothetical protein FWE20_00920 [Defluviitaleaceae bacterium]|nr:hypothetical protein [Defluviitaleaceae bacterium]